MKTNHDEGDSKITTEGTEPTEGAEGGAEGRKVTSAEVREFLLSKVEELKQAAVGYITLAVTLNLHAATRRDVVEFNSYSEYTGHSPSFDTAEGAIEWLKKKNAGRRESQLKREIAEALQAEAARLEAEGR